MLNLTRRSSDQSWRALIRLIPVGVAVAVILVTAGCTRGGEPSADSTIEVPSLNSTRTGKTPSPKPSFTGPMYNLTGFDVCEEVDRKPLSELSYKVVSTRVPDFGEHADLAGCVLMMRNPAGKEARLVVSMQAWGDNIDMAVKSHQYDREANAGHLRHDGDIDGIGDEAYGKSGYVRKGTQNAIWVRSGNLTFDVYLRLDDEPAAKREILAPKVLAIAKALLSVTPRG